MTLSVIGTGFGRTGTDSMRAALNLLGFGPCHHMREIIENPEQQRLWRARANGTPVAWEQLFDGYESCVDWPSAFYWRELTRLYPEAKVLLTSRSSESWLASINNTIFKVLKNKKGAETVGSKLIAEATFDWRLDDEDHVLEIFERHNAEVKSTIAPERLLIFEIGDGWQPLCDFLGVPVPDEPFPRSNSTSDFNARA